MAIALYMDSHVPRSITLGLRMRTVDVLTAIYTHPLHISIGQCIRDLEIISKAGEPGDLQDRVEFLPL